MRSAAWVRPESPRRCRSCADSSPSVVRYLIDVRQPGVVHRLQLSREARDLEPALDEQAAGLDDRCPIRHRVRAGGGRLVRGEREAGAAAKHPPGLGEDRDAVGREEHRIGADEAGDAVVGQAGGARDRRPRTRRVRRPRIASARCALGAHVRRATSRCPVSRAPDVVTRPSHEAETPATPAGEIDDVLARADAAARHDVLAEQSDHVVMRQELYLVRMSRRRYAARDNLHMQFVRRSAA